MPSIEQFVFSFVLVGFRVSGLMLNILNQTGISALAQANQMQQGVLSLLR